jgi:glycolate oxidase
VHRAIKAALDPAGLLNPGKVFRTAAAGDLVAVTGLTAER